MVTVSNSLSSFSLSELKELSLTLFFFYYFYEDIDMDKDMMIRESFDYILCIEDALNNNVKVPYGDHSKKFFTREELLKDLKFAYAKLHECLGN